MPRHLSSRAMVHLFQAVLAAIVVTAAFGGPVAEDLAALPLEASFARYKERYGRVYGSAEEETARLENFRNSLSTVTSHNAQAGVSFKMGINQFSDLSDEEFEANMLMKPQDCSATRAGGLFAQAPSAVDLPSHMDWRVRGVISEVKNQGSCGSCWSFSAVGCLEAHLALKYDNWRAPRLSEQQLVECAQAFETKGCNGGLPSHAFEYVRHAGGLSTEFSYPYKAADGHCHFNRSAWPNTVPFKLASEGIGVEVPGGSVNLTEGDETALKYYLATRGPVSVAYQVDGDFRHYSSGVYTSEVCKRGPKDVNHAVLAVGYGTDPVSGLEYWTIKNSWDYSFGMEGFFKIEAMKNMCGIANCNAFPDLYGINEELRVRAGARASPIVIV